MCKMEVAASSIVVQMVDKCSKPAVNRSWVTAIQVGQHYVQVICNGSKLYFYKEKKCMVICKLPGNSVCWCIALVDQKKILLCGLEDGRVCTMNIKDIIKTKVKERKPIDTLVKSDSTEDIFAGLLENEMLPSVDEAITSSNTENFLILDENSVVLRIENLVNFLMIGNYLFTASNVVDNKVLVSVFQNSRPLDQTQEMKTSSNIYFEKLHGCERIFKFRRPKSKDALKMYNIVSETMATAGQLYEVVIKDELFNEIFSPEENMLSSCMVLISLPDGAIVTIPFKDASDFMKTPLGTQRVLYNLHQPLALLCAIQLEKYIGKTLLLLGTEGKLLTIGLLKDGGVSKVEFKERYLQEPVISAIRLSPSMLLYSTGKELIHTHWNTLNSDQQLVIDNFSSNDLGITEVVGISEVYCNYNQEDDFRSVLVLTARGKIGQVQIPEGIKNSASSYSAETTGKRIEELLTDINNLATEMKMMNENSDLYNAILLEINKACHITSEVSTTKQPSLLCSANLDIDAQGTSKKLSIICGIANHSLFSLTIGWSFYVTIIGEHNWFGTTGQSVVISKSILLNEFHPGEKRRLKVNLTEENVDLPIILSLAVMFDASSVIGKFEPRKTHGSNVDLHNRNINIPITSMNFDILDALQPVSSQTVNDFNTSQVFQIGAKKVDWVSKPERGRLKYWSIIIRFQTLNLRQIIFSEGELNSEKFFQWLLPATISHRPAGMFTNTMATISPDGCHVRFSLSIGDEQTSITVQSEQMVALCQVVMAIHLKMMYGFQKITNKGLLLDDIQERIKNLKKICDEIEDYKCKLPCNSSKVEVQQDIQERMQIYINARSQLI